jgi:predicted enzyme related to lactoylglutathione lyase
MSLVQAVLARVIVDDIDRALPLYQQLSGSSPEEIRRFAFRDVQLAWVGSFLLLSGPPAALVSYQRTATLLVSDVTAAAALVTAAGGTLLEGPDDGPNGPRLITRHPDGSIFEYIQPRIERRDVGAVSPSL